MKNWFERLSEELFDLLYEADELIEEMMEEDRISVSDRMFEKDPQLVVEVMGMDGEFQTISLNYNELLNIFYVETDFFESQNEPKVVFVFEKTEQIVNYIKGCILNIVMDDFDEFEEEDEEEDEYEYDNVTELYKEESGAFSRFLDEKGIEVGSVISEDEEEFIFGLLQDKIKGKIKSSENFANVEWGSNYELRLKLDLPKPKTIKTVFDFGKETVEEELIVKKQEFELKPEGAEVSVSYLNVNKEEAEELISYLEGYVANK